MSTPDPDYHPDQDEIGDVAAFMSRLEFTDEPVETPPPSETMVVRSFTRSA
jgi:hypothetical protein